MGEHNEKASYRIRLGSGPFGWRCFRETPNPQPAGFSYVPELSAKPGIQTSNGDIGQVTAANPVSAPAVGAGNSSSISQIGTNNQISPSTSNSNAGVDQTVNSASSGTNSVINQGSTETSSNYATAGASQTASGGGKVWSAISQDDNGSNQLWLLRHTGRHRQSCFRNPDSQRRLERIGGLPERLKPFGDGQSGQSRVSFERILQHLADRHRPNGLCYPERKRGAVCHQSKRYPVIWRPVLLSDRARARTSLGSPRIRP